MGKEHLWLKLEIRPYDRVFFKNKKSGVESEHQELEFVTQKVLL